MPVTPVGGVVEITVVGRIHDQTTMNVFHYTVLQASTLPDHRQEMTALLTAHWAGAGGTVSGALMTCCPEDWISTQVTAQPVSPERMIRVSIGGGTAGGSGLAECTNLQASVTFRADRAARDAIGAKRICMSEFQVEDGNLRVGYKGVVDTFAVLAKTNLTVALGGAQYMPVIYHRRADPGFKWDRIVESVVQPQARVIRRRTVGVGI